MKLEFLLQMIPIQSKFLFVLWAVLLIATTALLLASVFFSLQTLQMRHFKTYPKLEEVIKNFVDRPVESLHLSMADHFRKVLPANEYTLARKTRHLERAMLLTKPGLICLALFLALSVGHYVAVGAASKGPAQMPNKETPAAPTPRSQS